MALIEWDETFSVGVKEIDMQHQKLMDMLNRLHDMMKAGKGKEVIGPMLGDLANYTVTHFGTEEKYFNEFSYDDTQNHMVEHAKFIDKVSAFKKDFEENNALITIELMNFLRDWLQNHIKGSDKKYTKCFNEHGLS